ncbi:hypothetical protein ABZV67_20695 [Streptomyces sp. NPDC005065]|uniref:hypothetical protein n=1 Tax=Streptomyces sp. NPDC005065 TaxID=3154461 RepID=UPI0033B7DD65
MSQIKASMKLDQIADRLADLVDQTVRLPRIPGLHQAARTRHHHRSQIAVDLISIHAPAP